MTRTPTPSAKRAKKNGRLRSGTNIEFSDLEKELIERMRAADYMTSMGSMVRKLVMQEAERRGWRPLHMAAPAADGTQEKPAVEGDA